ncbi:exo-alpha-sialidase [Micromonospora sp. ZYX-F-536]|uniref:exo-alpha-sialidase n=1 Tax=Micromonospora sp. ZYX-F-536 TaxID=3457629 RepID=UPI0040407D29
MATLLAIGTAKGLFLASSADGRRSWEVSGPHFPMTGVYAVAVDTRRPTPRLLAGVTSSHFGPSVATSDDLGASWDEPDHAPVAFPADTDTTLERVWQLMPAGHDEPDVVWAGAQPSALFRSTDGGRSFELVRSLWDHPHRPEWDAGFGGQAVHTVLPHPRDPARLLVAMSTGGVYRSEDAGVSWAPANTGIRAYFLPDEWPEFGQCVHKVARDGVDPDRLYAQNHHGVYRSDDDGRTWSSIADGLPSDFGFTMVSHPARHSGGLSTPVGDGAEVRVLPSVAGG